MTLDEMCIAAARYSDRYDEFEKNEDEEYEDDALHYFNVFRDAINEAYAAIARECMMPDIYKQIRVNRDGIADLTSLNPEIYGIKDVLNKEQTANLSYFFETKFTIHIPEAANNTATIYYHYIPQRLEEYEDTPVFPESMVDPMVYISLAVARIWMSEKKFDYANQWLQQHYLMINKIKNGLKSRANRKIPRRMFR